MRPPAIAWPFNAATTGFGIGKQIRSTYIHRAHEYAADDRSAIYRPTPCRLKKGDATQQSSSSFWDSTESAGSNRDHFQ